MTKCDKGTWSNDGATSCTVCPAGWACPSTEGNATNAVCDPGFYSFSRSLVCTECPAAYKCNTTTAAPLPCEPGFYSLAGSTNCAAVPAGYGAVSADSSSLYPCVSPGRYAPLRSFPAPTAAHASLACTICPAGFSCADPTALPVACKSGEWSRVGAGVCSPCPAGYYCSNAAVAAPVICPAGTYSIGNATACTACDRGYICPAGSQAAAPPSGLCPIGGFCDGTVYTPCPGGTRGGRTGLRFSSECEDSPVGFYSPAGSTRSTSIMCPTGFYCPLNAAVATPCPAGTYNPVPQQGALSACLACPAGSYCTLAATRPQICPSGYWCQASTGTPTACAAGTFGGGSRTGLSSQSQCFNCTTGSYCPGNGTPDPIPCAPGTYGPVQGLSACQQCVAGWSCPYSGMATLTIRCNPGYYCANGNSNPSATACPAGFYTDDTNLTASAQCSPCPPRRVCAAGTGGSANPPQICPTGGYCPGGSAPPGTACPAGTYNPVNNIMTAAECETCPPGSYCSAGSSAVTGPCSAGYYCPAGTMTANFYPCPAGTYNPWTNGSAYVDCVKCTAGNFCGSGASSPTACTAGSYCPTLGLSAVFAPCPAGYRCPAGTANPIPCGQGFTSAVGATTCSACPAGYYCELAATATPQACFAGTYCSGGKGEEPDFTNNPCPRGYYCPAGTTAPVGCPAGTYQPILGAKTAAECLVCPEGSWCAMNSTAPTGPCDPGRICTAGSTTANGTLACPSKTYRAIPGGAAVTDCSWCPSGYVCAAPGVVTPSLCPRGFYCGAGSDIPVPCPAGTYGNVTGYSKVQDCLACDPGKYCDVPGLTAPAGPCSPGYYCPEAGSNTSFAIICPPAGYCPLGSIVPTPCPPGRFSNSTGLSNATQCSISPAGFYSHGSSLYPTPCPAGYACAAGSVTGVENPAPAGSYAPQGSASFTLCQPGSYQPSTAQGSCLPCDRGKYCPNTGMTSQLSCPAGSYCAGGSALPTPCSNGTYRAATDGMAITDCFPCDTGKYCSNAGLTAPTGNCDAGFWCGLGSPVRNPGYGPQQIRSGFYWNSTDPINTGNSTYGGQCPQGYWCAAGTYTPTACAAGQYQPVLGGTSIAACLTCTTGNYCPAASANPTACPVGTFLSTTGATSVFACQLCPLGTFANVTGLAACKPCIGGQACTVTGLASPDQPCSAGYVCVGGATTTTPDDNGVTGTVCPKGSYCPARSSAPILCPAGTFNNVTGGRSLAEACLPCTPGFYCPSQGTVTPSLRCPAGYICPSSGGSITGMETPAPAGSTSSIGSVNATLCSPGTYQPNAGQSTCVACDAGRVCPDSGMAATLPCTAGGYCTGSNIAATPCPAGTYGNRTGLLASSACTACDAGYACTTTGLTAPNLNCSAGYLCYRSATTTTPTDGTTGVICPAGRYCPSGSSVATVCPAGTFRSATGGTSLSSCTSCTPGKYCGSTGLTAETNTCSGGYACYGGATTNTPTDGVTGIRCARGTFCPAGSANPQICTGGYYCPNLGQSSATAQCSAGYYCPNNGTGAIDAFGRITASGATNPCPAGFYCPLQTATPIPCAAGTFNNGTGGTSQAASCQSCPPGRYCQTSGQTQVTGLCSAGYICLANATSPTPTDGVTGYRCGLGTFCPAGTTSVLTCTPGSYCGSTGLGAVSGPCNAGYLCANSGGQGAVDAFGRTTVAGPTSPCPAGFYCPQGSGVATPCPAGTFNNATGGYDSALHCLSCTPGSYCASSGLTAPTGLCNAGFFCAGGDTTPNPM